MQKSQCLGSIFSDVYARSVSIRSHKKNKVVSRPEVFQNLMREGGIFFFFFLRVSDPDLPDVDVDCTFSYSLLCSMHVIHTCVCFRAYICTNTCLNIFHV